MDFEVYCDESGLEAISRSNQHHFSAIGSIWLPAEYREKLKSNIKAIKERHAVNGELKWKKISPRFFDLYKELIEYFFQADYIRFRVIIIETALLNHIKFNNTDAELGFYKFYYQLLHHWLLDFNNYNIFVDLKINRVSSRLKDLEKSLDLSNLSSDVVQVQGLPSEQSLGIQLADVLTGLVASKFNKEIHPNSTKAQLISFVESNYLGKEIGHTPKLVEKFNVFKINLEGGW